MFSPAQLELFRERCRINSRTPSFDCHPTDTALAENFAEPFCIERHRLFNVIARRERTLENALRN